MSQPENNHTYSTRLPLGKRGLESIPGNFAHVLLSHAIARLATVQCNNRCCYHAPLTPLTCLFSFYLLESMVSSQWKDFQESRSQHSLIYSFVQVAMEFYFLVSIARRSQVRLS